MGLGIGDKLKKGLTEQAEEKSEELKGQTQEKAEEAKGEIQKKVRKCTLALLCHYAILKSHFVDIRSIKCPIVKHYYPILAGVRNVQESKEELEEKAKKMKPGSN